MRVYTEAKEVPLQGVLEVQKSRYLMSNSALYIWLQVEETLPLRLLSLQSKWPVRFWIQPTNLDHLRFHSNCLQLPERPDLGSRKQSRALERGATRYARTTK